LLLKTTFYQEELELLEEVADSTTKAESKDDSYFQKKRKNFSEKHGDI
jgi:ABC-type siderophore export system fused ATPase/permease subunit